MVSSSSSYEMFCLKSAEEEDKEDEERELLSGASMELRLKMLLDRGGVVVGGIEYREVIARR